MTRIGIEIIVVLLLFSANGLFAMMEMAVVSSRKARLKQMAEAGDARAVIALGLADAEHVRCSRKTEVLSLAKSGWHLRGATGRMHLAQNNDVKESL